MIRHSALRLSRTLPMGIAVAVLWVATTVSAAAPPEGTWRVWLDSPGGPLPFQLELGEGREGQWSAFVINGPERIEVTDVVVSEESLRLGFPHYDSRIDVEWSANHRGFDGRWVKRRGVDRWVDMAVHGRWGDEHRFDSRRTLDSPATFAGRWRVKFESEEIDAVGIFEDAAAGTLLGTFLTATGDYRYLAGSRENGLLRLSTFDGAHAFLFVARPDSNDRLSGDFWSSDSWHETWTARRDPEAALPDGFGQTVWTEGYSLSDLRFPDLEGRMRALDDPSFAGQARILYVFGTWCPNCSDATELLVEMDGRYRQKGLSILGLAFEATGNLDRDSRQVRRYAARHHVEYPLLVAGLSDKDEATKALPILDRVRSYPTTIFLRRDGTVRAIYTGFSGPATGAAYGRLRDSFYSIVDELLDDNRFR